MSFTEIICRELIYVIRDILLWVNRDGKLTEAEYFYLYGEPTEIERYPNQLETRPYEIWQYT